MGKKIPKPYELQITPKQVERFCEFVTGDDLDFYEEFTIPLSDEEQEKFFEDTPDFMSEFPVSCDRIELLKEELFRGILRKIREYEGGKKHGTD